MTEIITGRTKVNVDRRMVLIPWQDMLFMFKDYVGETNLPADTTLQRVQYHQKNKGKMCFVVESENFDDDKDIEIRFDLTNEMKFGGS